MLSSLTKTTHEALLLSSVLDCSDATESTIFKVFVVSYVFEGPARDKTVLSYNVI